jgi:6-phosphogluconolactonase
METMVPSVPLSAPAPFSRRGFLRASTTLAALAVQAPLQAQSGSGQVIAYVGAYTDKGKGIHMFNVNTSDGTWTPKGILTGITSPSSIAFHPNKKFLYAINEISNYNGTTTGSATSMSVDPATGDLKILNVVSSGGGGPAFVSVDPSGKFLFAANYGGGSAAVIPIMSDGTLGAPSDVKKITGQLGSSNPAVEAPPGSFANSGHDAPHVHQVEADPNGNYVFVSDLGTDRIYVYALDKQNGTLTAANPAWVQGSWGSGPRHFVFHPNGRLVYAITEESSTMMVMDYDASSGKLTYKGQTISTLPAGFTGTNYASGIHISPDGKFLYGLNRLFDSVVIYDINPDGWLLNPRWEWSRGSYPRELGVDPTGNFMYIAHSRSDNITSYRIDNSTGNLTFTNQWIPVGNPSSIAFLTL